MNWVVAFAAVLFAVMVLSMIAPAVTHDPFSITAAFMAGVFVGMLLENAVSPDRRSEDNRRYRSAARDRRNKTR
jgi:hypothetical protein